MGVSILPVVEGLVGELAALAHCTVAVAAAVAVSSGQVVLSQRLLAKRPGSRTASISTLKSQLWVCAQHAALVSATQRM